MRVVIEEASSIQLVWGYKLFVASEPKGMGEGKEDWGKLSKCS